MTQQLRSTTGPRLLITCGAAFRDVDPGDGPILIGRDPHADLRIDHPMISRTHIQVEADSAGHWTLTDHGSRNGIFIDGERRESAVINDGMTVKLGNPADGVEVRFAFAATGDRDDATENIAANQHAIGSDQGLAQDDADTTDPSIKAAGAAVRARREELNITQRGWAAAGIINASALIAFEKGRSWPRTSTREKLEEELRWPRGTISQIRASYWANSDPDG